MQILKHKPSDRLTFDQIFRHKWMRSWEGVFNISIEDYVYKPDTKNPSTRDSYNSQESSTCDSNKKKSEHS